MTFTTKVTCCSSVFLDIRFSFGIARKCIPKVGHASVKFLLSCSYFSVLLSLESNLIEFHCITNSSAKDVFLVSFSDFSIYLYQFSSVQSLSHVRLFATP